jgi:plasmid stabilization system protein ParE
MAEISWTVEAQRWLEDIFEYIAADNPQAAARTVQGIFERAQDLKRFPQLGSNTPSHRVMSGYCSTGTTASHTSSRMTAISISWVSSMERSTSRNINSNDT